MIPISWSDFDKRHTWKPRIAHVKWKARQKRTIMRKLAVTISGDD